MTTQSTLTATLSALAALMPERVQWHPEEGVARVKLWGSWQRVYLDEAGEIVTSADASHLEYAMREECEERGWMFSLQGNGADRDWLVVIRRENGEFLSHAAAATPAQALAEAMVHALEGEGQ